MSSLSSSAASESYPLNSPPSSRFSSSAQLAKSRPPPPPLQLRDSSYYSSVRPVPPTRRSYSSNRDVTSPTTLLYELPPSASATSPRNQTFNHARNARTAGGVQSHYYYQTRSPPPTNNAHPVPTPPPNSPPATSNRGRSSMPHPRPISISKDIHTQSLPTPPSRPRSVTPSVMATPNKDIETFAQNCRAWFFDNDEIAGCAMSAALDALPPSMRASYMRIQASIRSAFHVSQSLRRLTEFRALLSSTLPGQSIPVHLRVHPDSVEARKERLSRLSRFITNHCVQSSPGTHAFFEALHAILYLQFLPANLGGAAERRIEWEVDDAVFIESAGKEFTRDAIDVLKGVLGMEERLLTKPGNESLLNLASAGPSDSGITFPSPRPENNLLDTQEPRKKIKPAVPPRKRRTLDSSEPNSNAALPLSAPPSPKIIPPPTPSQSTQSFRSRSRSRAISDPFSDPGKSTPASSFGYSSPLSRAAALSAGGGAIAEDEMELETRIDGLESGSNSYGPSTPLEETAPITPLETSRSRPLSEPMFSFGAAPPPTPPRTLSVLDMVLDDQIPSPDEAELDLLNTPQLRLWTFPGYILNPEIHALLAVFPPFIGKKSVQRFTPVLNVKPKRKRKGSKDTLKALEEGPQDDATGEGSSMRELRGEVKTGTGRMWVGELFREDGWRGGLWTRIIDWLRGILRH